MTCEQMPLALNDMQHRHLSENARTVCHHAPRATHGNAPRRRRISKCGSPPDSSRRVLTDRLNRSCRARASPLPLAVASAVANAHSVIAFARRQVMHTDAPVQRSLFRSALAALLMLGASPVLAQTPEEPSTRASLMETGAGNVGHAVRDATAVGHRTGSVLVRQPVPVREAVRRMEGHPSRRRRLPGRRRSQVRHRLRQGTDVGRSGSTPPQPRRSHSARSVQHQGLRASQCRRERTQSRWFARRRRRVRSVLRVPAGGLLRPWHGQPRVEPDQLPPGRD